VEIAEVGRGAPSFDIKHRERYLAEWLATSAHALGVSGLTPSAPEDTIDFIDAKEFRSAAIPAITVSSQPQLERRSFSSAYLPANKLSSDDYYNTYKLLCVFLLNLDRAARGASPQSTKTSTLPSPGSASGPVFTEQQASAMITLQIERVRDDYHAGTLSPRVMPELHDMTCEMARSDHLDPGPFEGLLKQKGLNGVVAASAGNYPNLSPEQMQGLKLGRFHKLSVATCILPSPEPKATTYWIAALVYE
jgi:hypothetical protein